MVPKSILLTSFMLLMFSVHSRAQLANKLKQQAQQFDKYRSQVSRQNPRLTSENAEMEIVFPKKLAQSNSAPRSAVGLRVGGSVRLQRSQREADDRVRISEFDVDDETTAAKKWLGIEIYRIRAFHRDFLLTVNPRDSFLAPNFIVQHVRNNDTWISDSQKNRNSSKPNWQHCFYNGIVNYERDSNVALSLCQGMFGIFRFKDNNYFIEPYTGPKGRYLRSSVVHDRPHLIYKFKTAPLNPANREGTNITRPSGRKAFDFVNELPSQRYSKNSSHIFVNNVRIKPSDFHSYSYVDRLRRSSLQNYRYRYRRRNGRRRRRRPRSSKAPPQQNQHRRMARSTSKNHYVELMVAADHRMRAYHGSDSALEAYILTLMAVVASVYKDASIGNPIHVLLMKVIIVHNEEDGPIMSQRAPEMLQSFCQWQARYNDPESKSPNHYDAAILLTRHDICRRSEKCDTLGLAEMGTICDQEKSCAVVEDNGLSAAFTIIHELGHLFNLPHDSDVRCRQFPDQANGIYHVMAPTLDFNTNPWSWSKCSRKYATDFLDNDRGHCLWNVPADMELQRRLDNDFTQYPGINYNTNFQCQLVFGRASRVCPYMPVCKRLWCTADVGESDGCRTQHMPWADGTTCGSNRWCIKGECVIKEHNRPQPVDGQWSSWSSYGQCSRTCGGGIKMATRSCNNPPPSNGGKFCLGERQKFKSCNAKECPHSSQDFREEQCAKYNGDTSRAERLPSNVFWVPKYNVDPRLRCKLYCVAFGTGISVLMESKVIDGTKCGPDTTDICVSGVCHPAGCDNRLYSSARYDACGVCDGDNSTCSSVDDVFTNRMKYGYNEIVSIPKGATNILVEQYAVNLPTSDENYLVIRNSAGEFLLNGNFLVNGFRREIRIRGAVLEYSGSHQAVERLNTTSQIGESIDILVLAVGSLRPARVHYKWSMSDKTKLHYRWRTNSGDWSPCDRLCQGLRYLQPRCSIEGSEELVEDHFCFGQEQPSTKSQVCNSDCQLSWIISQQSSCSATCGEGIIRRKFACAKVSLSHGPNITVADGNCEGVSRKPLSEVKCSMAPCYGSRSYNWEYSPWGQCSKTCGRGYRTRRARCVNLHSGREVSPTKCDRRQRKLTSDLCEGPPCLTWRTSSWEQCSVTCGRGIRRRHVHCDSDGVPVEDFHCSSMEKPVDEELCPDLPVCPHWRIGNWSTCSATCGLGTETRPVWCAERETVIISDEVCMRESVKPDTERRCEGGECPFWKVGPWSRCSKSCGSDAIRTRDIWCQTNTQIFDFDRCPPDTQPVQQEPCALPDCPAWIVSEWSKCSKTCGYGKRVRNVSCQPIELSDQCDRNTRPSYVEECKLNDCPEWVPSEWSPCSVTCGPSATQSRSISCRHNDVAVDEVYCISLGPKPTERRKCPGVGTCPSWHMTVWGRCSTTCGPGIRRRSVVCRNETTLHSKSTCPADLMPPNTQHCSNPDCAQWFVGDWKPCNVTCLDTINSPPGYKNREVTCRRGRGPPVPPNRCNPLKEPVAHEMCENLPFCTRFRYSDWSSCSVTCGEGIKNRSPKCYMNGHETMLEKCSLLANYSTEVQTTTCVTDSECPYWKSSNWTECSNSCGAGEQRRQVWCESNGRPASDYFCEQLTKPDIWRICTGRQCPNWAYTEWNKCSQSCGHGIQGRQIWCHLGNESSPLPKPTNDQIANSHLCRDQVRPPSFQPCKGDQCPVWYSTNFSECSAPCGGGRQYRSVFCVVNNTIPANLPEGDDSKLLAEQMNVLQINKCNRQFKPSTMRHCNELHCTSWVTSDWEDCKVSTETSGCGLVPGNRRRSVNCRNTMAGVNMPDRSCANEPRPAEMEVCTVNVKCDSSYEDVLTLVERSAHRQIYPDRRKASTHQDGTIQRRNGFKQQTDREFPAKYGRDDAFTWRTIGWGNCSASCGSAASRKMMSTCFDTQRRQEVADGFCDPYSKPNDTRPCLDLPPCTTWVASEWSDCSTTCGRGVQRRRVQCVDAENNNAPVESSLCRRRSRPRSVRYCLGPAGLCAGREGRGSSNKSYSRYSSYPKQHSAIPNAEWRVGPWGQCSASCGPGIQIRRVVCIIRRHPRGTRSLDSGMARTQPQRCLASARPSRIRRCYAPQTCPKWHTDSWNECPDPCATTGPRFRTRSVNCRHENGSSAIGCPSRTKPLDREPCPQSTKPCLSNKHGDDRELLMDDRVYPPQQNTSPIGHRPRPTPIFNRFSFNQRRYSRKYGRSYRQNRLFWRPKTT